MRSAALAGLCTAWLAAGCAAVDGQRMGDDRAAMPRAALRDQVLAAERGFAKTMADRDFAAFQRFLADDAVFFAGSQSVRGKAAVAADWRKYYAGPAAPFSWEPRDVEVLDDGTLALSSGPVRAPDGKVIAVFHSIWRREGDRWKIVFDKGSKYCE